MAIIKCEKGHFYDEVKYKECPHCKVPDKKEPNNSDDQKTVAKISNDNMRKKLASFVVGNDQRTVGIFSSKGKFMPVVGWFVCTDGNEKGRDYRIVSGRNFVGRSYQMDIVISDDPEISRENHCSVVYDPKTFSFNIVPGSGMVYINDKEIVNPYVLTPYDKVVLGKTTLQFIPYCKEGVIWE